MTMPSLMQDNKMGVKKPTILYVDDEQFNLDAFVAAFRRYYTIYTATSAMEAIKILTQHEVELIITDQRMPEMTGVQFLEAVIPEYPHSVRMILTGFSDIDAIIKSINNGLVLRYITKPWNEDELKQIIDIGIKIYRQEQSNFLLMNSLKDLVNKHEKTLDLFQKYVPKDITDQFVNLPNEEPSLKAENRVVSVLFSDIRQFTKLTNTLDSKALVDYLNKYFSLMINIVIKHQGYVYKLLGDGLIAVFGAPISHIRNQQNAACCAAEMIEALDNFNKTMQEKINFKTTIGISIATGEAVVGHTISKHFLSYSVIGEVVDSALKIEELTREMRDVILIDEPTCSLIKDEAKLDELGQIDINGKQQKIYKLISIHHNPE